MKMLSRLGASFFLLIAAVSIASAASSFKLNPLFNFNGSPARFDGSIQPGDLIGTSPATGLPVYITALPQTQPSLTNTWNPGETTYDTRATGSTNGFNMRGLTYDPVSGNLIFCDTHSGSGGSGTNFPWSAIYIMDADTSAIKGVLNTNGIAGGSYAFVVPGVSDDGVVYICNQTTTSGTLVFRLYRWSTANTNDAHFSDAPVIAFSGFLTPGARWGETMDVRGSGTNTQIILGAGTQSGAATVTNLLLFTTADGTNFTPRYLGFPGITTGVFNDGLAFGPGNTVFAKQVGQPLLFLSFDPNQFTNAQTIYMNNTVISSFAASSVNDPLLNISALAYDPINKLLAGLEEIGGIATGGRGKVWLFDEGNPTNRAPAVIDSRTYTPNFQKTLAPMGYLRFRFGTNLYAHASNNGFLCSSVDSIVLNPPTFNTDLPSSLRIAEGQNAHFEVLAVVDVTNYQWFSNNVPIAGVSTYFYDLPNVNTNMSGVFKVVASNPAGSTTSTLSTLTVVSASGFFHPVQLWSVPANTIPLNTTTNFITQNGGSGTPNERTIAYNALSNQLLVARGPSLANLKIMVVDADRGTNGYLYTLKTNGIGNQLNVTLVGIGVADDGAVYAAGAGSDNRFAVYRWADTGSNTIPITIFGTNSAASNNVQYPYNPMSDALGTTTFRFGDNLTVRGSGINTEILMDSQNNSTYASILTPTDSGMTNWTESGFLLQNKQGSYGSSAYGTGIGRSLQFGAGHTFYQKRYNGGTGSPLALMSYNPGGGLALLQVANTSQELFTNGSFGISLNLNLAAGLNALAGTSTATTLSQLDLYDLTDPAQAVLLSRSPLPGGTGSSHTQNGNAVAQVLFAANPTSGTNYIFVIEANNGVTAFVLSGGVVPAPKVVTQPSNLRVLETSSGSMSVLIDQVATVKWYKGTNSPVDTGVSGITYNIPNASSADAGDYFVIATNVNGSVTSLVAHVTVGLTNDNYTLSTVWSAGAGNVNFPFVSSDGGANTPNERAFAYNALSNQLIVVRCPPGSTTYNVRVVDASSGVTLYSLNTLGIIHEGVSEVSGSNPIDLVGAAAGDDGSIYICNESPNASGGAGVDTTKMFHVYRWTNSAAATPPVMVYEGDPSRQLPGINERWGDVLCARGAGTNTELFLNTQSGTYGAVLKPIDASLNSFTNYWFLDAAGGGGIGRSVQFGPTNTVYEKRKSSALVFSSYDTNAQNAASLVQIGSSATLGGVAVDSTHKLAIGVDFVGSTAAPAKPDAVSLYDISDPTAPMFIKQYSFQSNQVANANAICETIVSSNRVWALDGNNGMLFLNIIPPVNSMKLTLTRSGSNVNLSWGNNQAILQSSPSLSPQSWTDIAGPGVTNSVQPAASSSLLYRLIQRL